MRSKRYGLSRPVPTPSPTASTSAHLAGYLGPMTQEEVAELDEDTQATLANSPIGRSGLEQQYNDVSAVVPEFSRYLSVGQGR